MTRLVFLFSLALTACQENISYVANSDTSALEPEQVKVINLVGSKFIEDGSGDFVSIPSRVTFSKGIDSFADPGEEVWEAKVVSKNGEVKSYVWVNPETWEIHQQ